MTKVNSDHLDTILALNGAIVELITKADGVMTHEILGILDNIKMAIFFGGMDTIVHDPAILDRIQEMNAERLEELKKEGVSHD